jgi:hypothetical protein
MSKLLQVLLLITGPFSVHLEPSYHTQIPRRHTMSQDPKNTEGESRRPEERIGEEMGDEVVHDLDSRVEEINAPEVQGADTEAATPVSEEVPQETEDQRIEGRVTEAGEIEPTVTQPERPASEPSEPVVAAPASPNEVPATESVRAPTAAPAPLSPASPAPPLQAPARRGRAKLRPENQPESSKPRQLSRVMKLIAKKDAAEAQRVADEAQREADEA